MTIEPLPGFKHHSDPIRSDSIAEPDRACAACGQQRGWTSTDAVYAKADLDEMLCPWRFAGGTAHARSGAEFVASQAVGDYGRWDSAPASVTEEVSFRTPSFSGRQQERRFTHCKDATEFIAPMGVVKLGAVDPAAYAAIAGERGLRGEELARSMDSLHRGDGPAAYVFRCCHCGAWGGYSDTH